MNTMKDLAGALLDRPPDRVDLKDTDEDRTVPLLQAEEPKTGSFGAMAGSTREVGDILEPLPSEDWDALVDGEGPKISNRTRAVIELAHAQVEATEQTERYSFLILGFVAALAGYLVKGEAQPSPSSVSGALWWSRALLASSLVAAFPAVWLGHALALARAGFRNRDQIASKLGDLEPNEFFGALDGAAKWHRERLFRFDCRAAEPLTNSSLSWDERLLQGTARLARLTQWQSLFMRLQLLLAAASALALVLWQL